MKRKIYNFKKVYIVLLLIFLGIQFGFSQTPQVDYDIGKVTLSNYLSDGLEYQQSDNSFKWIDTVSSISESLYNDFIPMLNSTNDFSISLNVLNYDVGLITFEKKSELFHQCIKGTTIIKIEEEAIPNGFEFDIFLNSDWI